LAIADYLGSDEAKAFTLELKTEMKRRHKMFQEKIPNSAFKTVPNAAFYALVDTKHLDGEDAFKTFLENNVAVCPGGRFGKNSAKTVRVSLAGRSETFEKDIDMFSSAFGKINAN
jgi:aspartate/methionine/tyrosine aminotransferase